MVSMTFIWWIYHFWVRFWPYFNFVDFRAYFGPFSLVNRDRQKMADLLMKMASNKKMQENKPTLKFNFTIEKRWGVSIFELFGPQHLSHRALSTWLCLLRHSGCIGKASMHKNPIQRPHSCLFWLNIAGIKLDICMDALVLGSDIIKIRQ